MEDKPKRKPPAKVKELVKRPAKMHVPRLVEEPASRRKDVNEYDQPQQEAREENPPENSATEPAQAGPLVWNGFINRNQPQDMALLKAFPTGTVMARYSRNQDGIAYMDARYGQAIYFPDPETFPLKGYFAGEEIPAPKESPDGGETVQ